MFRRRTVPHTAEPVLAYIEQSIDIYVHGTFKIRKLWNGISHPPAKTWFTIRNRAFTQVTNLKAKVAPVGREKDEVVIGLQVLEAIVPGMRKLVMGTASFLRGPSRSACCLDFGSRREEAISSRQSTAVEA